jgi:hypothetical protein
MLAGRYLQKSFMSLRKRLQHFLRAGGVQKLMLTAIRFIGLGIWVAILSMAISAFFFRHGTEEDATLVFVTIMDSIVIGVVAKTVLRMCHNKRG